jgi:hypothetical protein
LKADGLLHKRTWRHVHAVSAVTPKADMCSALAHVCFGPIADIRFLLTKARSQGHYGRFAIPPTLLARADEVIEWSWNVT